MYKIVRAIIVGCRLETSAKLKGDEMTESLFSSKTLAAWEDRAFTSNQQELAPHIKFVSCCDGSRSISACRIRSILGGRHDGVLLLVDFSIGVAAWDWLSRRIYKVLGGKTGNKS